MGNEIGEGTGAGISKLRKGTTVKDSRKSLKTFSKAELDRTIKMSKKEDEESSKIRDFLDTAMVRLKAAVDMEGDNRKSSIEDLKFSWGIDRWDGKIKQDRATDGRPCLDFDLLTEILRIVIGDQRENKVKCKVMPVDSEADPEIAVLRQGIISGVEYNSNSERIYDYSMEMLCRGGYGAWEIKTRYTAENPFLQEIYMERISNPHSVYMGPGTDESHADARYGFKLHKMPVEEFKTLYPGAEIPSKSFKNEKGMGMELWYEDSSVMVASYYIRTDEKVRMALLSDGRVMKKEDADSEVRDARDMGKAEKVIRNMVVESGMNKVETPTGAMGTPGPGADASALTPMLMGGEPAGAGGNTMEGNEDVAERDGVSSSSPSSVSSSPPPPTPPVPSPSLPLNGEPESDESPLHIVDERDTYIPRIKHYKISPCEILSENGLEGESFPGSFIPLILVQGPSINIEGKTYVTSLIRTAKDPQRNYNYWVSGAAETVALAPKAEWIGTAKQFEGYENDYAESNRRNFPFLKYNIDDKYIDNNYIPPPPGRVAVKDPPVGMFTEITNARMAVKDAVGVHNRDVGEYGPERSGAAILAIQKPSDIGSFVFYDNLRMAIEHSHRVINSMIGEVYDSERDVRVRDETDRTTFVPINTDLKSAVKRVSNEPERYIGMDLKRMRDAMRKSGSDARFNDLTIGKYDVVSKTGPAYATQRAESAEQMLRLAAVDERIMKVGGDLVVRSMDFEFADELADRIEMTLPEGMVKPREGKTPPPPKPPDPQTMLAIQKIKTEELKGQREVILAKVNMVRLLKETRDTDVEIRNRIIEVLDELTSIPVTSPKGEVESNETGLGRHRKAKEDRR